MARVCNPDDLRSSYATLIEAGRERFQAAVPHYVAGIRRRFADRMTAGESRTVAEALAKVLAAAPTGAALPATTAGSDASRA